MKIATDNCIKRIEKIIGEVKTVVSDWEKYSTQEKASSELSNAISKTLIAPEY